MRLSVIIPTFNRADCIGRTLDSVLAQSLAADATPPLAWRT